MSSLILRVWITVATLAAVTNATAAYVLPQIGGGQVGMASAPMKHADITFDGTNIDIHLDDTVPTPRLRPLLAPDQFDPGQPWAVLDEKAYNFQYGWNAGGFFSIPPGTGIWLELLDASAELEVYQRPPAAPAYAPILGTAGSPTIWQWSGAMTHNVYAVRYPVEASYEASYRVYIGDETTGTQVPG